MTTGDTMGARRARGPAGGFPLSGPRAGRGGLGRQHSGLAREKGWQRVDAKRRVLSTVMGSGVALVLLAVGCVLPGGPDGDNGSGFPGGLPMERASVAGDGSAANGESGEASISADGRYLAFTSLATNLVEGDDNASADVFAAPVP